MEESVEAADCNVVEGARAVLEVGRGVLDADSDEEVEVNRLKKR